MSRSVPRNIGHKGEHLSRCDSCGVMYLRSALRRRADNQLYCPNDYPGRDNITLAQVTAARAAALSARTGTQLPPDGAFPDLDENDVPWSGSSYTGPVTKRDAASVYFETDGPPTYDNPKTKLGYPGF